MSTRKELKMDAKLKLTGNWGTAIGAIFVTSLISFLLGIIPAYYPYSNIIAVSIPIISILITAPLSLGISICFLNICRNSNSQFNDLFLGFNNLFKTIGVTLLVGIIVFLGYLLFIIPGIIFSFMYSQVYYVLADNPTFSVWECLKESSRLMIGKKFDFFVLELSFILWIILVAITFGIAGFYVLPYYQATLTNFYIDLKNDSINKYSKY